MCDCSKREVEILLSNIAIRKWESISQRKSLMPKSSMPQPHYLYEPTRVYLFGANLIKSTFQQASSSGITATSDGSAKKSQALSVTVQLFDLWKYALKMNIQYSLKGRHLVSLKCTFNKSSEGSAQGDRAGSLRWLSGPFPPTESLVCVSLLTVCCLSSS